VTASVGIAVFPDDSEDDDALVRHAGIAMNGARRHGPGRFAYFDEAMHAGAQLPFGLYDILDFLASSCETVADGFERIARYFTLIRPGVEYVIDADAHHPTVTLVDRLRSDDYFLDEWTLGVILSRFREQLAHRFKYVACALRRPKPADPSLIEASRALLGRSLGQNRGRHVRLEPGHELLLVAAVERIDVGLNQLSLRCIRQRNALRRALSQEQ
jgi:hypothetical protein